jgi:hypothetical protein
MKTWQPRRDDQIAACADEEHRLSDAWRRPRRLTAARGSQRPQGVAFSGLMPRIAAVLSQLVDAPGMFWTSRGSLIDAALAVAPRVPVPKPYAIDQITDAWLSQIIGAGVCGAGITHVDAHSFHSAGWNIGETTNSQRLRLHWNDAGKAAGLPDRVFVKGTPTGMRYRIMVAALAKSVTEVEFYRTVRKDLPEDIAPHAFAAVRGPGARFLLVLEDMNGRGYRSLSSQDRCTPEHAHAVTTALANLHARFWESSRFTADLSWVRLASQRPGRWVQRAYDRHARELVMSADYAKRFPSEVLRLVHLLGKHTEEMDRLAERAPLTLVHGDAHLGNTWTTREGNAGFYDWQLVHRRHGIQDFAHFLVHGVPASMRREHERPLVEDYVQTLHANGILDVSVEDVWERYRLAVAYEWDDAAIDVAFAGRQPPATLERVNSAIVDLGADEALESGLASL